MPARLPPRARHSPPWASSPTLSDAQAVGFPVGGEPLALDLADTLISVLEPPTDLLTNDARAQQFWSLQKARLPAGAAAPDLATTRALRAAIRALLEARIGDRQPPPEAVDTINAAAAGAPGSPCLVAGPGGATAGWYWHAEDGQALALAAAASSAIDVLTGDAGRLRRCANPDCSMLFLADTARRQWCAPNICGNRVRVARHYHRHRAASGKA